MSVAASNKVAPMECEAQEPVLPKAKAPAEEADPVAFPAILKSLQDWSHSTGVVLPAALMQSLEATAASKPMATNIHKGARQLAKAQKGIDRAKETLQGLEEAWQAYNEGVQRRLAQKQEEYMASKQAWLQSLHKHVEEKKTALADIQQITAMNAAKEEEEPELLLPPNPAEVEPAEPENIAKHDPIEDATPKQPATPRAPPQKRDNPAPPKPAKVPRAGQSKEGKQPRTKKQPDEQRSLTEAFSTQRERSRSASKSANRFAALGEEEGEQMG